MTMNMVDSDGHSIDLYSHGQERIRGRDYGYEVISRLIIKYTPEKLNCTFLSEKLAGFCSLREFMPPPDHNMIKPLPFDNFFPPLRHSRLSS